MMNPEIPSETITHEPGLSRRFERGWERPVQKFAYHAFKLGSNFICNFMSITRAILARVGRKADTARAFNYRAGTAPIPTGNPPEHAGDAYEQAL